MGCRLPGQLPSDSLPRTRSLSLSCCRSTYSGAPVRRFRERERDRERFTKAGDIREGLATLEISRSDLDQLPLALLEETMPWFKKFLFGKKKAKKARREISQPSSFQHCYHATVDSASGEFVGLPPQWVGLVGSVGEKPPKSPSSSRASSSTVVQVAPQESRINSAFADPTSADGRREETLEREASVLPDGERTSQTPASDRSGNSSPVSALTTSRESGSTSTTTTSGSRRVPIIRGSDTCLEETIKYIRKHYRSASSASPASFLEDAAVEDEQFVDIHFGSRSRSGSLMQLRGGGRASRTPSNGSPRPGAPSFTSISTHAMHNATNAPSLPTNSPFCMSAPHNLNVQSDLGLFDCETATLFRSHIHSPSESSGYFGSTVSSLCSSRISALSSIQQIHPQCSSSTQPMPAGGQQPQHRCSTLHETSEFPWIHPQMRHGQSHFSSLQRPAKFCRTNTDGTPHSGGTRGGYPHSNSGSNIANFTGSPPSLYGTTPRAYAHRPRGDSVDSALIVRNIREKSQPDSPRYLHAHNLTNTPTAQLSPVSTAHSSALPHSNTHGLCTLSQPHHLTATPSSQSRGTHFTTAPSSQPRLTTTPSSQSRSAHLTTAPSSQPRLTTTPSSQSRSAHLTTAPSSQPRGAHPSMNKARRQQFHQHRRPMMTSEQFRATLELLVNRSDPRRDYCELAKIGEGSTGVVFSC